MRSGWTGRAAGFGRPLTVGVAAELVVVAAVARAGGQLTAAGRACRAAG
ncbi:hypothetical protein [Micromonospora sp. LOL_024]